MGFGPFSQLGEVLPLCSSMPLSFDDLGINFFFNHYVPLISNFSTGQVNPTLPPIWSGLSNTPAFHDAISSIGFAGLSNVSKNRKHMVVARRKYVTTLRRTNAALQNPEIDPAHTFNAVLLLALFEIVGGTEPGSWSVHIDGGAALLKAITKNTTSNGLKLRMLLQFCFSVCVKCISRGEPTPDGILEWCQQPRNHLAQNESYAIPLIDIISRFVNLYSGFRKGLFIETETILDELLGLETELVLWESNLPDAWKYVVASVPAGLDQDIFNGETHIHGDLWTAGVYNNYRWARIIINELIWVHESRLSSFITENEAQFSRDHL